MYFKMTIFQTLPPPPVCIDVPNDPIYLVGFQSLTDWLSGFHDEDGVGGHEGAVVRRLQQRVGLRVLKSARPRRGGRRRARVAIDVWTAT